MRERDPFNLPDREAKSDLSAYLIGCLAGAVSAKSRRRPDPPSIEARRIGKWKRSRTRDRKPAGMEPFMPMPRIPSATQSGPRSSAPSAGTIGKISPMINPPRNGSFGNTADCPGLGLPVAPEFSQRSVMSGTAGRIFPIRSPYLSENSDLRVGIENESGKSGKFPSFICQI